MIRYEISADELKKRIQQESLTWFERTKERTERFRKLKKYKEESGIWSEIKPVYVKLQQGKCAYCEKKLEEGEVGLIEWDVEHYRPKSQVRLWGPKTLDGEQVFAFSLGKASEKGYYLLPYHFLNYAAACKSCNSPLKSDFFPVASKRRSLSEGNPVKLLKEKPFLPYPISSLDEDPENLLTFQGYFCVPAAESGHRRNRALVTIAFFRLNDRDTLLKERAEGIEFTWAILERLEADPQDALGTEYLDRVKSDGFRHANCIRSYVRVFQSNRALAKTYLEKALEYLRSKQNPVH